MIPSGEEDAAASAKALKERQRRDKLAKKYRRKKEEKAEFERRAQLTAAELRPLEELARTNPQPQEIAKLMETLLQGKREKVRWSLEFYIYYGIVDCH
jgi:hypothetical protein